MKNASVWVLVICLFTLIGCNTKQGYVAKGNHLYDEGKYAEAALNYRNAIKEDPQYGEAYYRLGLTSMKQDHATLAYETLFHAVQLLPGRIDIKKKFAEVCLAFYLGDPRHPRNYYNQLTDISNALLAQDPNSFDGLKIKAYLAAVDRRAQDAIALFRKALQIDASDPAITGALIQNLFRNGDVQEGEKMALDLTARQKSYGPAYDLLYERYTTTNRMAEAENILKTKVENNPKQAEYILELAAHFERLHRQTEMKETLQRLLDDPADFPEARLSVGDFYVRSRDYPEAIRYYTEGAANDPKQKTVYQKRTADVLLAQGKTDEAFRIVEQILREDSKDYEAMSVHADLLLRTGTPQNVAKADYEFQALSQHTPGDAAVWFGLGEAKRMEGDLAGARENYLKSLQARRGYLPARYQLAEVGLDMQRPQEALQQANEILKARPDDKRAQLLHARSLIATDPTAAKTELTALVKNSPQDLEPQFALGLVALARQNYAEATAIFTKLQASGDPRAIAGLGETDLLQKQLEKAFQILNEGIKTNPASLLIHEQLAKAAALTGRYDVAVSEYRHLVSSDPKSVDQRLNLAEVYAMNGAYNDAIREYQRAKPLAPGDLRVQVALAGALDRAGRTREAQTEYESILKTNPEDPATLNNAAIFFSQSGNLDEALTLAQKAVQRAPRQAAFSDTIGYIYLKKGQRDSAIRTFRNLVRSYPGDAVFQYHLGMALFENGDKVAAKKELEGALAHHPSQQDAQRIRELLEKIS